ncbi:LysR substrate-binding domain-containing protein [Roseibacterium sp. SDUM158016]|uniref:LysR substrate-binding domain-containing protein n=1 Tax=Roseicyclus sediminis TaxID=2980997 RepID=UPI0021D0F7DC|nr:LysR substrate-binding domain-containing protein [Roseibacterium sp. SDUM158016]MCU4654999.1 LysR substrate-binding domain-containing protein [Roseibacterium sp. SDUM158016]
MKLPPLHSMRAFEAVARLGSVTAAADELCVTNSAVSHQVAKLEDWMGFPLVERHGRGIILTAEGERYKRSVCEAFRLLHNETDMLRRQSQDSAVRVSSLPMFAVSWLMTQMHDFWARHPDVRVALHYSRSTTECDENSTDVAIRFGRPGDYPEFVAMPLLEGTAIPVAAPGYLTEIGYTGLADFDRVHLLHDDDREYWGEWLACAGLDRKLAEGGPLLPDGNLTLAATIAGEGVGLLRRAIIKPQLRSGTLVPISDISIQTDLHYLVLTPRNRAVPRGAMLFVQWLQSLPGTMRLGVSSS